MTIRKPSGALNVGNVSARWRSHSSIRSSGTRMAMWWNSTAFPFYRAPRCETGPGLLLRIGTAITAVRRRARRLCYATTRTPTARSRGAVPGAPVRRRARRRRRVRRSDGRVPPPPVSRADRSRIVIGVPRPPRLDLPLPARSRRWSRFDDSTSGSQYLHLEAGWRWRGWSERRCRQENGDHPGTDLPTSAVRRVEVLAVQADASMTEVEILEAVRHLPALGSLVDE